MELTCQGLLDRWKGLLKCCREAMIHASRRYLRENGVRHDKENGADTIKLKLENFFRLDRNIGHGETSGLGSFNLWVEFC